MTVLTHRDIWRMKNAAAPTYLYRVYDESGVLVYIGIARELKQRLSQHRADKPWWPLAGRCVAVRYSSRREALAAELTAIDIEAPRWNIQARGRRRKVA